MTRVYNVYTHYDSTPVRVRAKSPKAALAIGLQLTAERVPQFRFPATELAGEGGRYQYRDCRPLETPYAVRSNDQRTPAAN